MECTENKMANSAHFFTETHTLFILKTASNFVKNTFSLACSPFGLDFNPKKHLKWVVER